MTFEHKLIPAAPSLEEEVRVAISGTSMSAPNVANLAAKLLAIDRSVSPRKS